MEYKIGFWNIAEYISLKWSLTEAKYFCRVAERGRKKEREVDMWDWGIKEGMCIYKWNIAGF